jgi:hypothetical protein
LPSSLPPLFPCLPAVILPSMAAEGNAYDAKAFDQKMEEV